MDHTEEITILIGQSFEESANKKKRITKNRICNDIFDNINTDPKSFWNLLNKLNSIREQ